MLKNNIKLDPRQTFYYARELYYNEEYDKSLIYFNKFLNDDKGWVENKISACLDLYYLHLKLNDENNALLSLFKSFKYHVKHIFYNNTIFIYDTNATIF